MCNEADKQKCQTPFKNYAWGGEREYTSNNDESKTTEFYESKYMSKIEREKKSR